MGAAFVLMGTTFVLPAVGCGPAEAPEVAGTPDAEERPELGAFFREFGAEGTFVLLEEKGGVRTVYNPARAAEGFLPASTFKILNSLVALEAGVVEVDEVLPWDGAERSVSAWNEDQRMRDAFQRSTVWFYQELARRVGLDRMQEILDREDYGNRDPGGGIDEFWLTGDLRITAAEQVDFLRRLKRREVGFAAEVVAVVEELMVLERCGKHTLRGKTGWARPGGTDLGWLVGWVDRDGATHYYAMNLESREEGFPMIRARMEIVKGILGMLGVLPPECADTA